MKVRLKASSDSFADLITDAIILWSASLSFLAVMSIPMRWAWNYVVSPMFELPQLTWGGMFALLFFSRYFYGMVVKRPEKSDGI